MRQYILSLPQVSQKVVLMLLAVVVAGAISMLTANFGSVAPLLILSLAALSVIVIAIFRSPRAGLISTICYCFLFFILVRESGGDLPFGIGIEVLLLLTWLATVIHYRDFQWSLLRNDLAVLFLVWFIISVLQIAHPGASVMGWLQELRSSALYPVLFIPLGFLLFNRRKDIDLFLIVIISLSVLAALNGMKQMHLGLSPGEQKFLDDGAAKTHVIWGRLRIFSFFSHAGQFGVSQAHIGLITFILALGPFKMWKKVVLFILSGLIFYGMLISGTRGALFALIVGAFFAIALSKNWKILIVGSIAALAFLAFLKFTTIGNGHYEIYRLRTALDPQDASLNVRYVNQQILRDYLSTRPFGGGLGVIGNWGETYNKGNFLSTIPPDSYWVKVWAMYGIVGMTLWFGMIMYIIGKCSGIIWKIKNAGLRYKLIALCAGTAGIFFASYGNEIINDMPSAMIVYLSWVFIYMAPRFDKQLLTNTNED